MRGGGVGGLLAPPPPPRYTRPMPPRPGDIVDLEIHDLAYGGQGIARLDDFVVFVRGAVPGDTVTARIGRRKARYAEARLLEILRPSDVRVPPSCPHAPDCGGCEWQTIAYDRQLEFKQRQVLDSLRHIGGLEPTEVRPIAGMAVPWRYRNKMEYSFGEQDGELVLGLHRRGSWRDIVEIKECLLASEPMNAARTAVAEACRELGLPAYGRDGGGGLLRHLVVREGRASGDLALNLYVRERFAQERELVTLVAAACSFTSFGVTVNTMKADAAVGEGPFMLEGPPYLRETLAGVDLRVPLTAFLQTNSEMCELLYGLALECAALASGEDAYDLYCGIGSLSLALARRGRRVHAIEIQEEAIVAARENAGLNAIASVDFAAGDVRRLLKEIVEPRGGERRDEPPTVVVVDPPRAGMARKALARAAALGARRFVYVSCNPTTLAGNGAELRELGYDLRVVAPVDMFPQTHHIETVALFERTVS